MIPAGTSDGRTPLRPDTDDTDDTGDGVANRCDACGSTDVDSRQALCYPCADRIWDRWLDRHDDIGADE